MREARISIVNTQSATRQQDGPSVLALAKERIEKAGRDRPDLVLISETFANYPTEETREVIQKAAQSVPGPISEELSAHARKLGCYIAFGMLRRDGEKVFNSLVLLDREGRHVWTFDKVTPTIWEMENFGVTPGGKPEPYRCDFGLIGGAICYDINFLELAELYARQGVELVLFSSAFPAGRLLDVWAIRYGMNIAGSTWFDNNRVIDCAGAIIGRTSELLPFTTACVNLNRRVVHMDFNLEKLEELRTKHSGDVIIEDLRDEAVCVITSRKQGLEVSDLVRELEIEPLFAYFDRSRKIRAELGGMQEPNWW